MEQLREIFSKRFADAMRSRNISVADVSRAMEAHPATVHRWLRGQVPQTRTLRQLEGYLGVGLTDESVISFPPPDDVASVLREEGPDVSHLQHDSVAAVTLLCERLNVEQNAVVRQALRDAIIQHVNEIFSQNPKMPRKPVNFK